MDAEILHICAMIIIFGITFLSAYSLARRRFKMISSFLVSLLFSLFIILALHNFDMSRYLHDTSSALASHLRLENAYPIFFGIFSTLVAYFISSRISAQAYRSLYHILTGVILLFLLIADEGFTLIIISIALILLTFGEYFRLMENNALSRFVEKVLNPAFRGNEVEGYLSSFLYLVGVFLIVLFLPKLIAITSVMILAFSDPTATIIGKRFGKTKWKTNPDKSVEGSLGMFTVSLIVLFSMQFFHDLNLTILTLFFVAIAITIVEALPLKIGDNILIPVLAGMVMIGGHAGGNTPHIWLFLLPILGALVYSFKMLDLFGTAIAMFFGLLVLLSATQQFLMVLMCFLVLGFLISRFKYKEKEKIGAAEANYAKRGINPVIASGIMSTFSALLYTIEPRLSIFLFSGAISTALANVFATEIGVLQKNPRILFKFEKVKAGTRGAVSLLGEVGGIVGALLMGSAMAYLFSDYRLVFVSLVAGFFGCNVDSIMGSYVPNITKSEVSVFATLFGGLFALIFY